MTRLLASALLLVACTISVHAQALEIRVRGESRIAANVTAAGTIAQVSGTLSDDLNRPLPQRELEIYLDSASSGDRLVSTTVLTGPRGEFQFQEEFPPGNYVAHIIFNESDNFEGVAATETVELRPSPVSVRVVAPQWTHGANEPIRLFAQARAGSVGVQGVGIVSVNGRRVGEMEFEPSGRGSFDLQPFAAEGENVVQVIVPGSQHRDPAQAEATFRVSHSIEFDPKMEMRIERLSRGIAIYGSVRDAAGPVKGARVQGTLTPVEIADEDIEVEPRLDASAISDEDGDFVVFFDSTKLADGVWQGDAVLVPPVGATVTRAAGTLERNTALQRFIFDLLGFVVVLFGAFALAGGLIDRLRRAIEKARKERARREEERAALQAEEKLVPVFLDEREVAFDGPKPTSSTVGGVVWDIWQQEPIPNAIVRMTAADGQQVEVSSDERGRFRFDDLAGQTWSLEASAFGFIRGTMQVSVPHDGRLARCRLDLVAVPLKVRRLYQTVVARDPRGGDFWGRLSPAEIEDAVREVFANNDDVDIDRLRRRVLSLLEGEDESFDAEEIVSALTRMVEESYFSGRRFDERVFFAARDLALRLRAIAAQAIVLLAGAMVFAVSPDATAQPLDDYEPTNAEWNGLSDFVDMAEALGTPMKYGEPLDWDTVDIEDPIILVYPSQEIDAASFSKFVVEGGRVVIADDFGESQNLLARLEITRVSPSPGSLPHEKFVGGNQALPKLTTKGRHPLLPGVDSIVANHPSVISNIGGPVVSFDAGGGLVYDMNLGRGKVIVVSDASIFINQMLVAGDNRTFARNVLTYACNDPLVCNPRLFSKAFEEKGRYGDLDDDSDVVDSIDALNDALSTALERLPAREFLYWVSLLLAIGLGAYLVTVFPLRRTRRYSAYVTDFIDAIPTPQGEFDWNLSRFGTGARTMNYALPMAILKEHFEELFLGAFGLWPSKASERPGVERLAQDYVARYWAGASSAEQDRIERETVELLATFAQLPPRNRVFLDDDARFRDVDLLKCHRRAMAILERMDLKDEYERRTSRTR